MFFPPLFSYNLEQLDLFSLYNCTCTERLLSWLLPVKTSFLLISAKTITINQLFRYIKCDCFPPRHLSTGRRDEEQGLGGENTGSSAGHKRQPTKAREHEDRAEEADGCSRWKAR